MMRDDNQKVKMCKLYTFNCLRGGRGEVNILEICVLLRIC